MKRAIPFLIAICLYTAGIPFFSFLPAVNAIEEPFSHLQSAIRQKQLKLVANAQLLEYKSLCALKDAGSFPSVWKPIGTELNSESSEMKDGCKSLEKKIGRPTAVRISLQNQGNSNTEIPIESLSKIIVNTKDGNKVSAVAWRSYTWEVVSVAPAYLKPSRLPVFTTGLRGGLIAVLKPGEKADLLFLFPTASTGDLVQVGELISVKID